MQNRFFGMLATIMMCGAVMTGLTACSNEDNNDGNVKEKQVARPFPTWLLRPLMAPHCRLNS